MKRHYLILSFLFFTLLTRAQNLVPNYSFELYSSCPNNGDQLNYAIPWYSPTTATPDYFNTCGSGGYGAPLNIWGYQNAKTGNGYGQIAVYGSITTSIREYLQIALSDTLVQGKLYCISFYVSQAGISYYSAHNPIAITEIGLLLSNTAVSSSNDQPLPYTPQIVSPVGTFITDTVQWVEISGLYTALGGEKYLTIGNFKDDASTDTVFIANSGINPQGYYYVDDVSIIDCDSLVGLNEELANQFFTLFPNPNSGNMTLKYNLLPTDKAFIDIFDLTGKLSKSIFLPSERDKIDLSGN